MDPVHALLEGTPAQVEAASRSTLDKAARDGGFMLMPGCDIPPNVPEENLRAFLQAPDTWAVGAL
ncbi:MAG: hypothetical protein GTO63_13235 [Anaerolineae bacterium]|nr:hypothetical protein [Anaerolineae bacterium]NIN95807.1 hypothetical protein [Anaerolineae bacterium]NIQ78773.1 hypothetical protein [Anaerolineae bacterium]